MTQKLLRKIGDNGGLIRYVREGNPLPPIEFVKKFASTIKYSCLNEEAFKNENGVYKVNGVEKPATIFSIESTREKITFDKGTGLV
jgi:hypothetical protein